MSSEVQEAVDAIVDAFGHGRMDDYFARFDPGATFVFHTTPERLTSLDAYRALWADWVRDTGLRVMACTASDPLVQEIGDVAIVTHTVQSVVSTNDGLETLHERETIVLRRGADGAWLAVHEHLSAVPQV